jgi:CRP-like cAMP-binding protein
MSLQSPRAPLENRLLNALPRRERDRLRVRLEPVYLPFQEPVYDAGRPIPYVYFPLNGVLSLVAEDGSGAAEVGTVGNEGLVGLPVFLGTGTFPHRCFCQIPGDALRLRAAALREELNAGGALAGVLLRYTHCLLAQATQTAACNLLHAAEQRLARLLLLMQDRVGIDWFPLTQELMAQMLGVQRATVSLTAGALQRAGLIGYSRGRVMVRNRAGLEAAACGCYRVVSKELERLLG